MIQMGDNPMRRAPAAAAPPAPPRAMTGPLPEGWRAIETDQGETYYYAVAGTTSASLTTARAAFVGVDHVPGGRLSGYPIFKFNA